MKLSPDLRTDLATGVVDREIYTSEKIFALERERIFTRTWHYACTTRDLKKPGDYFTVSIAEQPVLVIRGNDGEIRAFHNACTHRGAILTGERCGNQGQTLKCMYHAWAFNLKGDLTGVPHEGGYGPGFDRRAYGLRPVHCDTFYDLVFVAIRPTVPSLTDFLGEMADHLAPYVQGIEPIGRNSWIYQGNWKFWHENFRDDYHAEFTHRSIRDLLVGTTARGWNWGAAPGHSVLQWAFPPLDPPKYARALQRFSGVDFSDGTMPVGWSSMLAQGPPGPPEGFEGGPDGGFEGGFEGGGPPEIRQEVLALFPNLDIQPGPKDTPRGMKAGFLQTVTPLGVDRTRVDITVYSDIEDDAAARQEALENLADTQGSWGKLSCDDTEAATRCQIGVRGEGGPYSLFTRGVAPGRGGEDADVRDEYSQREFFRVYQQYLQDES
ncbi:Rieske 2Fe-2S domain-containing protein [Streptomyces varsoviensis]|uniref:aromatic ring-hydroxylating oxygenase subunit alpha n=1 Tax=Streptomyces varsoviensis TaxID=67373 RepID=UPI0034036F56